MSILNSLITSKTRVRILMRLFLNPEQKVYVRELSDEFGLSPSQIAGELQRLSEAKMLTHEREGRQVKYRANKKHALFPELQSMVRKSLGMDRILDSIIERLGDLEQAFLIDDYAEGKDTGLIDLVLIGNIEQHNLNDLVKKTEKYIDRKIRVLALTVNEYKSMKKFLDGKPCLELWKK